MDFLLALLKPNDWLKGDAEKVLKTQRGSLWTSLIAVVEALMVGREFGLDPERMVANIVPICRLEDAEKKVALRAAAFMARHKLSTFDAFHAAFAMNDVIISSDKVFDKVGLKRIPLF